MHPRVFQIVRMAKLGMAMVPTLTLRVLIKIGVGLVLGYKQIPTNFNKKSKPTGGGEGGSEIFQDNQKAAGKKR